jgi:hypothetical protein
MGPPPFAQDGVLPAGIPLIISGRSCICWGADLFENTVGCGLSPLTGGRGGEA